MASPLLTALDHAGRSNWLVCQLASAAWPFWQASSASVIGLAQLLDHPVHTWLLMPAGQRGARGGMQVLLRKHGQAQGAAICMRMRTCA